LVSDDDAGLVFEVPPDALMEDRKCNTGSLERETKVSPPTIKTTIGAGDWEDNFETQ